MTHELIFEPPFSRKIQKYDPKQDREHTGPGHTRQRHRNSQQNQNQPTQVFDDEAGPTNRAMPI